MHLAEGILPPLQAVAWSAAAVPFLAWGLWSTQRRVTLNPDHKPLIALIGAAVFIISCMPVPVPFTGTCSHPCGTGMAAILIGAGPTVVVAFIALLLQALFLAHGGLSTLGLNLLGMGVVAGLLAVATFRGLRGLGVSGATAAFAAGLLSDWGTYAVTATGLGLLAPAGSSFWSQFALTALAFAPTQIPLGIAEGVVSAAAWRLVATRRPDLLVAGAKT
jgi:cobalt/nickel transport system permease protein